MTRSKLDDRRPSVTQHVEYSLAGGHVLRPLVTFGFDRPREQGGRVREMFCADFKAGSDNQVLIADACIVVSLLLQHGYTARQLADRLSRPPSLLGALVLAGAALDEEEFTHG